MIVALCVAAVAPAAEAAPAKRTTVAKADSAKKSAKKPAKKAAKKPVKKTAKKPDKKKNPAKKTASRKVDKGTTKVCKTEMVGKGKRKKSKRTCRKVKTFQGHGVARATLRTEPLTTPSGQLDVWVEGLGEGATVDIYARDAAGQPVGFDDGALAQLDEVFRCKRTHEVRAVDPKLYEQLSRLLDHFRSLEGGSKRRLELVSGLRYKERDSSRHHHASAADIRIPGVTIREMYAYAESLDPGGMGIGLYPTSGFIHVDWRAPGESSYRWTDLSGPDGKPAKKKKPTSAKPRTTPARRPTS